MWLEDDAALSSLDPAVLQRRVQASKPLQQLQVRLEVPFDELLCLADQHGRLHNAVAVQSILHHLEIGHRLEVVRRGHFNFRREKWWVRDGQHHGEQ